MDKLKTYLAIAALIIIAASATYLITTWSAEQRIQYVTGEMQQRLDSLSVVKQAALASRDAIEDSLEALDKEFSQHVTRTNQKISSYVTVIGSLRIERDQYKDSASALAGRLSIGDLLNQDSSVTNTFKDTLVSRTETWSDSLLATHAIARFENDSLSLESRLERLRDMRFDIVTTESEDRSQMNIFVRSPDLDSVEVRAVTEIKPQKRKPWGWTVAALLLLKEGVKYLLK